MNQSMIDHAARVVRRTLERASAGDEKAQRDLLRFAAAETMETALMRLAALADKCAPTLDEIKVNRHFYSGEAQQLRFAVDAVPNILNQAAGRAVVLEMPKADAGGVFIPPIPAGYESRCTGDASDNGELPRVPLDLPPTPGDAA